MATATLELVNPYAKYGLKRRPTYDEIANLISENETLTGTLPNRDATFFKKTPQGSFFDGTDHLEILKEEQNRIMERQMREMMLRQNARRNGGTFNIERLRSLSNTSSSTPTEVQADDDTRTAQIQTDLSEMERRRTERGQQTGQAHREELTRQSAMPTLQSFLSGITSPLRRRPVPQIDLTRDETQQAEEEFFPEEMTTAREEEPERETKQTSNLMKQISYSTNISRWNESQLEFQLYIRGIDVSSPEYEVPDLRKKGKGRGLTKTQHLMNLAQTQIINGDWDRRIEEQLLQSRIQEYKNKNKSRSSTG